MINSGFPGEMHLFLHRGRSSGLGEGDLSLEVWPELLDNWLRAQGFL
jgi:hypothetical protein